MADLEATLPAPCAGLREDRPVQSPPPCARLVEERTVHAVGLLLRRRAGNPELSVAAVAALTYAAATILAGDWREFLDGGRASHPEPVVNVNAASFATEADVDAFAGFIELDHHPRLARVGVTPDRLADLVAARLSADAPVTFASAAAVVAAVLDHLALINRSLGRAPSPHHEQVARVTMALGVVGDALPSSLAGYQHSWDVGRTIAHRARLRGLCIEARS